MTGHWRPITHDDVPAWNALLATAEKLDATGEHYNEGDLHEELDEPEMTAEDRVGAFLGERMVAYAATRSRGGESYVRVHGEGTVDPELRGHGFGRQGVDWITERARVLRLEQQPRKELRIEIDGYLDNAEQVALLEDSGYQAVNWSASMRVRLSDPELDLRTQPWPSGYTLHGYSLDWSDRVLAAHNAAFLDHWGFTAWTQAGWRQWEDESRNARPGLGWFLVHRDAPDTVAGYLTTHEYDAYEQATGRREAYVAKVGVRREHRGRGLASRLLRHALASYRAAGYDEASLDVDTNNPTGAFGVYERAGFVIEQRTATFQRVIPAEGTGG